MLSSKARQVLIIAMANKQAGIELADAIDAVAGVLSAKTRHVMEIAFANKKIAKEIADAAVLDLPLSEKAQKIMTICLASKVIGAEIIKAMADAEVPVAVPEIHLVSQNIADPGGPGESYSSLFAGTGFAADTVYYVIVPGFGDQGPVGSNSLGEISYQYVDFSSFVDHVEIYADAGHTTLVASC